MTCTFSCRDERANFMIYFHFFLSFFYNYFSMQEEHVHVSVCLPIMKNLTL
jgi:hypothetical protein